jgi:hypothetical protein
MYSSFVPEISRFFGIVIRMFVEAGGSIIERISTRISVKIEPLR